MLLKEILEYEQIDMFPKYDAKHRAERFKQWYADSAVGKISSKGNTPNVVYHATTKSFNSFNPSNIGALGSTMGGQTTVERHGMFFAEDPKFAEEFIEHDQNGHIIPVYLSIKNPFDLTNNNLGKLLNTLSDDYIDELYQTGIDIKHIARNMYEHNRWQLFDDDEGKAFVDSLKKLGHDGAFMIEESKGNVDSNNVWVAFYPSQIKSIYNTGEFSKNNTDIMK